MRPLYPADGIGTAEKFKKNWDRIMLLSKREAMQELRSCDACSEGLRWFSKQRSVRAAYDSCPRGDWLLWVLIVLLEDVSEETIMTAVRLPIRYQFRLSIRMEYYVVSWQELGEKCGADREFSLELADKVRDVIDEILGGSRDLRVH